LNVIVADDSPGYPRKWTDARWYLPIQVQRTGHQALRKYTFYLGIHLYTFIPLTIEAISTKEMKIGQRRGIKKEEGGGRKREKGEEQ